MIHNTSSAAASSTAVRISIASDFSRYPAGRFKTDGPFSGERFRDEVLVPRLKEGKKVDLYLDGTLGYGSSFLEEAFGGLVRVHGLDSEVIDRLAIYSSDASLAVEIKKYIDDAVRLKKQR